MAQKNKSPKQKKISKVLREFKEGKLRSGSKKGPKVQSHRQAVAIALRSADVPRKK